MCVCVWVCVCMCVCNVVIILVFITFFNIKYNYINTLYYYTTLPKFFPAKLCFNDNS